VYLLYKAYDELLTQEFNPKIDDFNKGNGESNIDVELDVEIINLGEFYFFTCIFIFHALHFVLG
jgi:hypothetical protein